jgi:Zn-dependent peptidase ImmA (M78 family)
VKRIPSVVDFGLAVIHIRQVTVAEMRDECDAEADEITPDGLWDAESDTIFLLRKLSRRRKREVLFHELVHAAVDNQYWARHAGR